MINLNFINWLCKYQTETLPMSTDSVSLVKYSLTQAFSEGWHCSQGGRCQLLVDKITISRTTMVRPPHIHQHTVLSVALNLMGAGDTIREEMAKKASWSDYKFLKVEKQWSTLIQSIQKCNHSGKTAYRNSCLVSLLDVACNRINHQTRGSWHRCLLRSQHELWALSSCGQYNH